MITAGDFFKYQKTGMPHVFIIAFLAANTVASVILIYFIFRPGNYAAYILLSFCYGTANLLRGGSIIGFLLFLLCTAFLYKRGFLRRHKEVKSGLPALYMVILVVLQLRFGFLKFSNTVLHIGAVIIFMEVLLFLFTDEIHRYKELFRSLNVCDRIEFLARYSGVQIIWEQQL